MKNIWACKTIKPRILYEVKMPNGEWVRLTASRPLRAIEEARRFYEKNYV